MDCTQELLNGNILGIGSTTGLSADLDKVLLHSQNEVVLGSQSQELVELELIGKRHLQNVSDMKQRLNERDKFIEYIISKLSPCQKLVISEQWKSLQANKGFLLFLFFKIILLLFLA